MSFVPLDCVSLLHLPCCWAVGDKQEEGFFKMDEKKNTFVYVQGLPTDDFTLEQFSTFMSKCGIIALDSEV